MPRVAQIAATGNHSFWFADVCGELSRRGCEVLAIIDSTPGNVAAQLESQGIRYVRVPMIFAPGLDRARLLVYLLRLPFTILRVARILRREKIEIAQSHIFVANVVGRVASLLAGIPHITTGAGPRQLEAPFTRMVERLTLWMDAAVVAGCEYMRDLYRGAGARHPRCIYYGPPASRFDPEHVDRFAFRRQLGVADDELLVGIVAHYYPPTRGPQTPPSTYGVALKGQDVFVTAAMRLAPQFPHARFVLVGSGSNELGEEYRRSLIDACRAAGLEQRILFTSHQPRIAEVLASLDVAVQCALTEGLGGTIEGLLMERPMVATAVGGMPESVVNEVTGLLVPPADAELLAAAIARLLTNRAEAVRFGRNGRVRMLERFTLTRTGQDLVALYEEILARSSPANGGTPVS